MEGGLSKAQKKNARKVAKRREESIKKAIENNKSAYAPVADPVQEIKKQLAEAKERGDVKLTAKLRQDLWILQDVNNGIDPLLDDKKAIDDSLNRLSNYVPPELVGVPAQQNEVGTLSPLEKSLKKLNKKLREIDLIKEKQASGVTVEQSQLEKLKRRLAYVQKSKNCCHNF